MSVKVLNPGTPGQRFKIVNKFKEITKYYPEKTLTKGKVKSGGRNNHGKITMRYIGGGHKKKNRIIDCKRDKYNIPAIVKTIEYDPNRSSFISLLFYIDGDKRYIITPGGLRVGAKVISGSKVDISIGNAMYLSSIPIGTILSCVEIVPGKGAVMARSAGSQVQLLSKDNKYAKLKLPSGEIRIVDVNCMATIGSVSNVDHQLTVSGKAGRNRYLGIKPRTRGVAMNPVDHPMGGGEGRASGGIPRSRSGVLAKGFKTRLRNKVSSKYILFSKN